jgi:hypothetical protein
MHSDLALIGDADGLYHPAPWECSGLVRNDNGWYRLLDMAGMTDTLQPQPDPRGDLSDRTIPTRPRPRRAASSANPDRTAAKAPETPDPHGSRDRGLRPAQCSGAGNQVILAHRRLGVPLDPGQCRRADVDDRRAAHVRGSDLELTHQRSPPVLVLLRSPGWAGQDFECGLFVGEASPLVAGLPELGVHRLNRVGTRYEMPWVAARCSARPGVFGHVRDLGVRDGTVKILW